MDGYFVGRRRNQGDKVRLVSGITRGADRQKEVKLGDKGQVRT